MYTVHIGSRGIVTGYASPSQKDYVSANQDKQRTDIIKWSIFFGLIGLITLFFLVSYFHARRRITRGQEPLAYHRWMVRRHLEPTANLNTRPTTGAPVLATYVVNERGEYVLQPLQSHVPPAYNTSMPPPPVYPGPPGATKIDPNQDGYLGQQQTGTTYTSASGTAASATTTGEGSSYGNIPPPMPAHAPSNAPPVYYMPQTAPQQPGGPTHPQYTQ
jgi:hypothetical protein